MKPFIIFFLILLVAATGVVKGQKIENEIIREKVAVFKNDPKGPYQQIMWFCPDGSRMPPKQRCPEKGGVQRATYNQWVEKLATNNHIYLGQILSATDFATFFDQENQYSRLKQYEIEKYLVAVDNGWILQKARYYRGAFQDEDENNWGIQFLEWLLNNSDWPTSHYFLLRQTFKDIPHKADNSNLTKVRVLSMELADSLPKFMNIRIKIHGQPDVNDLKAVKDFKRNNGNQMSSSNTAKIDVLISELEILYQPVNWSSLNTFLKPLGVNSESGILLKAAIEQITTAANVADQMSLASNLLLNIRKTIPKAPMRSQFALLDLSNRVEELLFKELPKWETTTVSDLLKKNYTMAIAATGAGYIELWEWDKIATAMLPPANNSVTLEQLNEYLNNSRRLVEWGSSMIRMTYRDEVKTFEAFEPKVTSFVDDRIRSSVLLQFGQSVGNLGNFIYKRADLSNKVFTIANQSQMRGINPGFAKGELVVAETSEGLEILPNKIYVFTQPPYDLKPVAGIATVTEGNLVSHVQLLARNLGIPNAVLSNENLLALKPYAGKKVFYTVSNQGTVIMKLEEEMTVDEKELFAVKKRLQERIKVPVDKIDLKQQKVLNLRQVNATSSGKICGPKAANLGQLKMMFPDHVVEGLVIPFGIFKQHLDQKMPSETISYWSFLNNAFSLAVQMEKSGSSKSDIDAFILKKLEYLRTEIQNMPLIPAFVADIKSQFSTTLGNPMGKIPVFVRSDTNMEDLKDFTGAGLNLTLFNVVDEAKILEGIKTVWASPYTERSFQWRQSYLLNPENVYPSILIIPSVNVNYSGVLITKGVSMGTVDDLTIAFSRGAGGAVDGQLAESYLLKKDEKNILLAPSREQYFNNLPKTGGTQKLPCTFNQRILTDDNLRVVRDFSKLLKQKMAETKGMQGPFDVEMGFSDNKLWLFQVRPFVENKNAAGASYLESITPKPDPFMHIQLTEKL